MVGLKQTSGSISVYVAFQGKACHRPATENIKNQRIIKLNPTKL